MKRMMRESGPMALHSACVHMIPHIYRSVPTEGLTFWLPLLERFSPINGKWEGSLSASPGYLLGHHHSQRVQHAITLLPAFKLNGSYIQWYKKQVKTNITLQIYFRTVDCSECELLWETNWNSDSGNWHKLEFDHYTLGTLKNGPTRKDPFYFWVENNQKVGLNSLPNCLMVDLYKMQC